MTGGSASRGFAAVEHWTYEVESPFRSPAEVAALASATSADESQSNETPRGDLEFERRRATAPTTTHAKAATYEWEYRWMADELEGSGNLQHGENDLLEEVDRNSRPYAVWVQHSLNHVARDGLATDGKLGPRSRAAIMRFQAAHGLTVDGIAGPMTEAALVAAGATSPPGTIHAPPRAPGGSETAVPPTPGPVVPAAIPITVPATCVEVPALLGPDRACAGVDSTGFAGIAEVARFCGLLSDCYADRMAVRRQRERHAKAQEDAARAATATRVANETRTARAQRIAAARAAVHPEPVDTVRGSIRASYLRFLEEDFRDTILGAKNRWGRKCLLWSVARMWMFGVRERLDFVTLDTSGRSLGSFGPPSPPPGGDQLVDIDPPATTSGGAKVQPILNAFLRELRGRGARHSAYTYPGHGGGSFKARGYSIDLELAGPKDERGFYQRPAAAQFLLAIDAAARAVGVQWRAIYNDYAVAAAVNRHLDRKHVIFVGQVRRGQRLGLNWHGPLILHFHVDIAPQSGAPAREEESGGLAQPHEAERSIAVPWASEDLTAAELQHVDPTAEYSPEALGDLEWPAAAFPTTFGEDEVEGAWIAPSEALDTSEARHPAADVKEAFTPEQLDAEAFTPEQLDAEAFTPEHLDAEAFTPEHLDTALFYNEEEGEEDYEDEQPEWQGEQSAVDALEALVEAEIVAGSSLADGVRGVATLVLGPSLRRGSSGPAVAALQRALRSLGYDVAVDGALGPSTERAVRALQGRLGVPVDGVVGPQTKAGITAALSGRAAVTSAGGPAPAARPTASTSASATGAPSALVDRILRVMELLVAQYGYPVNGAAGLVGNLTAESAVMPNRLEGSQPETPMRAQDFAGRIRDFTPEEVRDRDFKAKRGPRLPGIGLAQWTTPSRREGLFRHVHRGRQLGVAILEDLDAQVDYLVTELRRSYAQVESTLKAPGVTVDDATDDVVYRFEVPGSILQDGQTLPRSDPRVQAVFQRRRASARRALDLYRRAHPR